MMIPFEIYENCILCPRNCRVNRSIGEKGFCGADMNLTLARASLHMWEEPCISGTHGSGAIFFSHCNLGCIFCQNREISHEGKGLPVTIERLAEIISELEIQGAENINLVTAAHYLPSALKALEISKPKIPVVYNCGGYESVQTLKMAEDKIDVYMPDLKYTDAELAGSLSMAPDYPEVAKKAIDEMVRQKPALDFNEDGIMTKGVLVRHLILPGHTRAAISAINYLADKYGDNIYISLLRQYTPMPGVKGAPDRKLTSREYDKVVNAAIDIGLKNVFIQEKESASSEFIPKWNLEGIVK